MGPSLAHTAEHFMPFFLYEQLPVCRSFAYGLLLQFYSFTYLCSPQGQTENSLIIFLRRCLGSAVHIHMQFTIALFSKGPPVIYTSSVFPFYPEARNETEIITRANVLFIYIFYAAVRALSRNIHAPWHFFARIGNLSLN